MINVKYILRPFAGFLSTFAICMAASAQECSDLAVVHDLLPSIDNQISGKNTLAYNDGPLEPGKTGYGFGLRETLFDWLAQQDCVKHIRKYDFMRCKQFS